MMSRVLRNSSIAEVSIVRPEVRLNKRGDSPSAAVWAGRADPMLARMSRSRGYPSVVVVLLTTLVVAALPAAGMARGAGLPPSLRGVEVSRLPTRLKVVALTFDGGSNDGGAFSILRLLAREHVSATFFLTGRWAATYPGLARRIARDYLVGNHSLDHPHLTRLSSSAVRHEITGADALIRARSGADPKPLFRFPYGEADARTIVIANSLGYVDVRWSVDTLGWKGRAAGTPADLLRRVLRQLQPGAIVLMHLGRAPDGTTLDTVTLPSLITALRARGYAFVTLASLRARATQRT